MKIGGGRAGLVSGWCLPPPKAPTLPPTRGDSHTRIVSVALRLGILVLVPTHTSRTPESSVQPSAAHPRRKAEPRCSVYKYQVTVQGNSLHPRWLANFVSAAYPDGCMRCEGARKTGCFTCSLSFVLQIQKKNGKKENSLFETSPLAPEVLNKEGTH